MEHDKQAEAAQHAKIAGVIATFAKRAKEAALVARASLEDVEIGAAAAPADAATTFADATPMRE